MLLPGKSKRPFTKVLFFVAGFAPNEEEEDYLKDLEFNVPRGRKVRFFIRSARAHSADGGTEDCEAVAALKAKVIPEDYAGHTIYGTKSGADDVDVPAAGTKGSADTPQVVAPTSPALPAASSAVPALPWDGKVS